MNTMLVERLRANLHDYHIHTGVTHNAEYPHELNALGGGVRSGYYGISHHIANGADNADPMSSLLKDALKHICRGRLAVGSGDAYYRNALCRLVVKLGSHFCHCNTGVWHYDLRQFKGKLPLCEKGGCAPVDCGLRKLMPIQECAVDTYEQVSGFDTARVIFDTIYIAVSADDLAVHIFCQLAKTHNITFLFRGISYLFFRFISKSKDNT